VVCLVHRERPTVGVEAGFREQAHVLNKLADPLSERVTSPIAVAVALADGRSA